MGDKMTAISEVHTSVTRYGQEPQTASTQRKDGDSIFAHTARKVGMDSFADFLRDDWSAKMARKLGCDKFADWIENKEEKESTGFEKVARAAVKHPVLTIAAVALSIYGGKQLYKTLNKSKIVTPTPTPVPQEAVVPKIDEIPHDIDSLNKMIEEGLEYERNLHYKNLEIFKNSTDKERELMLTYFRSTKKEKDLLLFASGNKPSMVEGITSFNHDIFDSLRSDSVRVAEFFTNSEGNFVFNNDSVRNIVKENLQFFQARLGLPETTTAEEVFHMITKSTGSCLGDKLKYADLRSLILGYTKKDAHFAQLRADMQRFYGMKFYDVYRSDYEGLKTALRNMAKGDITVYKTMSPEFKTELLREIDSLSEKAYRNLIEEPNHVFQDAEYDKKLLEGLRNLALKLKQAQNNNATIGF